MYTSTHAWQHELFAYGASQVFVAGHGSWTLELDTVCHPVGLLSLMRLFWCSHQCETSAEQAWQGLAIQSGFVRCQ